jgi:hypothetical protein
MPNSQQSWVRFQHPPTQWNLRSANEAVLNNIKRKNQKKIPIHPCLLHTFSLHFYFDLYKKDPLVETGILYVNMYSS